MNRLTSFDREVLMALPPEPNGLSKWELADGLLNNRGPRACAEVLAALGRIIAALGGLHARFGDDYLGHAAVPLFGVRAHDVGRVRLFFRDRGVYP